MKKYIFFSLLLGFFNINASQKGKGATAIQKEPSIEELRLIAVESTFGGMFPLGLPKATAPAKKAKELIADTKRLEQENAALRQKIVELEREKKELQELHGLQKFLSTPTSQP